MNDLMTKSFLSYVDLKKQAMKDDCESGPDIEMGQLDPADERNLTKFFDEVGVIKADMDEITHLLVDLQDLNEETKSTHSAKVLRGLRDRINSDMVTVLRKAKIIKGRLESLDKSNEENCSVSAYRKGSPIDRTRISVSNGLRIKLRDMMNDFRNLREKIVSDHKEGLKIRYYSATGEQPSEEVIEKMISGNHQQVGAFEGKADMVMENQERHEAVNEIQKSLTELHQVFLDMAVMIETQGEQMNDIVLNVANARSCVIGAKKELERSKEMKKRNTCACWIGVVVLVMILICIIAILF